MSFAGKPVEAYFTASCGGLTATPQMVWGGVCNYPYARQRCQWCRASSHYRWTRQADAQAVFKALAAALSAPLSSRTELAADHDEAGFVRAVGVRDAGREWTMSADEFRRATGRRLGWNVVLSGSFTLTFRFADPGADTWHTIVNWGGGKCSFGEGVLTPAAPGTYSVTCSGGYNPGGSPYTITVYVSDGVSTGSTSLTLTVAK